MNKELQNKLFEKYPKIFRQKDLPMQQTAMCWGIACGDGWYNIIDSLSAIIQSHVEWLNGDGDHDYRDLPEDHIKTTVEATQVKEKYGGLRFYCNRTDDVILGAIRMAERLSSCTCEECGAPGTPNDKGWIHTLCDPCRKNIMEIRKKNIKEAHHRIAEDHKVTFEKLSDEGK